MIMKIKGKYEVANGFTTVFAQGTIYTLCNNSDEVGSVSIGERTAYGATLTENDYARMEAECDRVGTFEI